MPHLKKVSDTFSRVLVVYKKSAYQLHVLERKDPHLRRLLRQRHPDLLDLRRGHDVHARTLEAVLTALRRLGVEFRTVYRAQLESVSECDLVVAVGGDGTILHVSHLVGRVPVLGVNSDPARSEAVFCAANPGTCARMLHQAVAGALPSLRLVQLAVRLNGRRLPVPVLNDVLIAHEDPSTMSRYRLSVDGRSEPQKSSGLWVATAAGSSSAIWAAGGRRMPWTSRRFQYRPRELYRGRLSHPRLTGGILPAGAAVHLTWLMRSGMIFIDGPRITEPLRFGDRISVSPAPDHSFRLLGFRSR